MKGAIVIVIIALIYTCSLTSAESVKRSEIQAGQVNATLEEVLKANFSSFATRLQNNNTALWNRIVNASEKANEYLTIFAPTNAAVLGNESTSANQLSYHVHTGDVGVSQIVQFFTLPTLFNESALNNNAQVLAFTWTNSSTGKTVTINGDVNMVDADILATNGIVHSVSKVIALPSKTVGQRLGNDFPTLSALAARVNQTLSANYITLLAPTEAAFTNLFNKNSLIKLFLLNTSTSATWSNINNILAAHVVTQAFYPSTLNNGTNTFTTLAGSPIEINKTGVEVQVISGDTVAANVVTPNMLAANGVVHSIDNVLVPSTFSISLLEALQALDATKFINVVTTYKLESLLNESSLYTIFVPTNAALNASTVTSLNQALYHVANVKDANFIDNLMPSLLTLPSLNNAAQKLFGSTVNSTDNSTRYINGVSCTGPYYTSKGTTIYMIDTTLQPPAAAIQSLTAGNFNTFVGLLQEKQLSGHKDIHPLDTNALTLFAPTDMAFNALPHGALGYLRLNATDNSEIPVATALINNHIVPGNLVYTFNDANVSLATANGDAKLDIITVGKNPVSTIYNGEQRITIAENPILLENGVAHPIDEVILPANVGFNAINLLEGLGLENASIWGSYTQFVDAAKVTGLIHLLEEDKASFTIFPPNDDAWNKATESFDFVTVHGNDTDEIIRIQEILNYHIVYHDDIEQLNKTNVYKVGNNTNNTLEVTDDDQVTLYFPGDSGSQGSANIKVITTTSYGQKIYGIDRVLGVGVENSKKSGLTTLEWILIGVGGAVLGLIILLIVAGAAYYLLVRPKSGYRKIN